MVNEQGSSPARQTETSGGFNTGTAVSSFAGALVALLVGGGVATLMWPETTIMAPGSTSNVASHPPQDMQVAATGAEDFVHIDSAPMSVNLTFDEAGTYRIELRALDGASDPLLTLYAADSVIPFGSNDDAPGTLDAILPLQVADASDTWRVEVSSFGETNGPSVLRVLPATDADPMAPLMTSGPGAFPSGDVSMLASGEPTEASVDPDGVWYTFKPEESGVHVLSVRAAVDGFDTVASLIPVLEGREAPLPGSDVNSLSTAFTSDDDDGLNPRFVKYLQAGADYYLFIRGFETGTEGSIAISLDLAADDTPLVLGNPMEAMEETYEEPEIDLAPTDPPSGGGKLNAH